MLVRRVTAFHHRLLRLFILAGDTVVDCTAGNGHDALFLAEAVGPGGRLIGFDVQEEALARTRERLLGAGIDGKRFELVLDSHERIAEKAPPGIGAAVYNLGFLPGGGRDRVTKAESTVASLGRALEILRPGGVASLVLYSGHDGGEESRLVAAYAASLDWRLFKVLHLRYPNLPKDPPSILLIQRDGGEKG